MKKSGFTMIELIFVIVILGILAAVAIPKLAATRTDAKIASTAQQIQSAVQEIPQYVTAKGKVDGLTTMSQVLKQLSDQGKTEVYDAGQIDGDNSNQHLSVKVADDNGDLKRCIDFEVNNTTLAVSQDSENTGAICTGVKNIVKDANYTIAGSSVTF